MSIKPEYVKKILDGTKKYEFRKRISKRNINKLIIYSTAPQKIVVGEVEILEKITMKPTTLWEKTKKDAGISRKKFREYFKGCDYANAYKLGEVKIYNPPKTLEDFNIKYAPQSFIYL